MGTQLPMYCTCIPNGGALLWSYTYTILLHPRTLLLHVIPSSPLRFMVLFWSGNTRLPSLHTIKVLLRSSVTFTVTVDVMDVPVLTSVTVNWNGGSENTWPWLLGRSARVMPKEEILHWCAREGTVHVNVTLSPGQGLSTLDCNWVSETNKQTNSNNNNNNKKRHHAYKRKTACHWELHKLCMEQAGDHKRRMAAKSGQT